MLIEHQIPRPTLVYKDTLTSASRALRVCHRTCIQPQSLSTTYGTPLSSIIGPVRPAKLRFHRKSFPKVRPRHDSVSPSAVITRESIHEALLKGIVVDDILAFLQMHSKDSDLPLEIIDRIASFLLVARGTKLLNRLTISLP